MGSMGFMMLYSTFVCQKVSIIKKKSKDLPYIHSQLCHYLDKKLYSNHLNILCLDFYKDCIATNKSASNDWTRLTVYITFWHYYLDSLGCCQITGKYSVLQKTKATFQMLLWQKSIVEILWIQMLGAQLFGKWRFPQTSLFLVFKNSYNNWLGIGLIAAA